MFIEKSNLKTAMELLNKSYTNWLEVRNRANKPSIFSNDIWIEYVIQKREEYINYHKIMNTLLDGVAILCKNEDETKYIICDMNGNEIDLEEG